MSRLNVKAEVVEGPGYYDRRTIHTVGRVAQTLEALVNSGSSGITGMTVGGWAVRLSHYIFMLRTEHQLDIETVEEEHGGQYPGKHGRYFLRSDVQIISGRNAAA